MLVYRIVKGKARTTDLSGTGAYRTGGRWNSKGTYMLYTSESSSLAYLETLVHFEETDCIPNLFIIKIKIADKAPLYTLKEDEYPAHWLRTGLLKNKILGDKWMSEKDFLGIKVKSAVNELESNYLLNPLFPGFHDLVKIIDTTEIKFDKRVYAMPGQK
jgi:RES domain-containing protein